MRRLRATAFLLVVLLAAPAAFAEPLIRLIAPEDSVRVGYDFDVLVEVTSDVPIAMVQLVLDNLNPALELTAIDAPLASEAWINPPDTAVMDYHPYTLPSPVPGAFIAGTLTFEALLEGVFVLDLGVVPGSTMTTALFDENYDPIWDFVTMGTFVETICIPEPLSMALIGLVGLGGVFLGACRAKK